MLLPVVVFYCENTIFLLSCDYDNTYIQSVVDSALLLHHAPNLSVSWIKLQVHSDVICLFCYVIRRLMT